MADSTDRFFIPGISRQDRCAVPRDEAHHITHVLRMAVGDELIAFDGTGAECRCRIATASGHKVILEVLERREVSREPDAAVTLAIAAAKNKAMDLIVQKCTELGLARLIPFHAGRSVARIDDSAKIEKWRRVTIEAAKQCGRNVLPRIDEPRDLDALLAAAREHDLAVVAAVAEKNVSLKQVLCEHPQARKIMYVIGPEGGFAPDELARITGAGIAAVSLGRSVLRVETAAIAALAMIVYHYGNEC